MNPHCHKHSFQLSSKLLQVRRNKIARKNYFCLENSNMNRPTENDYLKEIIVNGYKLVERKEKILVIPEASDRTPKTTIHEHFRSIQPHYRLFNYRSYTVKETFTEGKDESDRVIETQHLFKEGKYDQGHEMSQEEVERFEKQWSNLWNPELTADVQDASTQTAATQTNANE